MALDRDQVGLLFKVNADTTDAVQSMQLFRGVVEGMAAETSEQLTRLGSRFSAVGSQVQRTGQQFASTFGDTARGQLAGYVSQFGLLGDAAASMIPSLSGSAAGLLAVSGAAVAAGAALVGAATHAMEYTGQIDDLAKTTGITTETIQSLRLAATLSGQSFEEVSQTAVIFQKRIEEAKDGNADLANTFNQLGVDLNGPVDQAFRKTLESLGRVEDGSTKTATTLDLFGRSGAKLLPVMGEVGGSFDDLTARARELGIVIDQETIAKTNELADKWDILKLQLSSITVDIGIGVIGFFSDLAKSIELAGRAVRALIVDTTKLKLLPQLIKEFVSGYNEAGVIGGGLRVTTMLGQLGLLPDMGGETGFQGPGIDENTGLPLRTLRGTGKTGKGGKSATGAARQEESFQSRLRREQLDEERRLIAESTRLRLEAMQDEEDKVIAAMQRIEDEKLRVRLQMAQQSEDFVAQRILGLKLQNLETEGTITNRKLLDLQNERAAQEEAYDAERLENIRKFEEAKRAEAEKTYQNELRLNQALNAMFEEGKRQRMESLAKDPSSPLSIFGPEGQKAADQGKGIFEQLGASATSAISTVSQQIGNFSTIMVDAFGAVANGLQNIITNFIMTGRIGGQAFKALAAQVIAAVTAQAAIKAIFEIAEGFAANAVGNFYSASQHFTAAKFYGTVAGIGAAAAVGLAAIGGGGGGQGDTMFLGQDRRSGSATLEQGYRRRGEPQVIIIRAETEPGVMVSKFVQDYRSNGEARSALRRDILGEF